MALRITTMTKLARCTGILGLLLGGLAGCGTERPHATAVVRDSLGVTIVESFQPAWGPEPRWSVDSLPVLALGKSGAGPDQEFFRVRDATRLPDGTVAVVSEGSADVRFYSPAGVFLGAVGRKGEGPGEFQRPISVDLYRGDSLLVFDYWIGRFTVLDPSRAVARVATFRAPFTHELQPLPDGRLIVGVNSLQMRDASVGRVRVPRPMLLASPDGTEGDTITVMPGLEEWVFEEGSGTPPLVRTGSAAVLGDALVTSDGESVVLRIIDLEGTLRALYRIQGYPLTASAAVRDSIRQSLLTWEGPEELRAVSRLMAEAVPETFPGVMDIMVDSQGCIWAAEYFPRRVTGQSRTWLVFDSDGVWLGKVTLPADFDAFEAGTDYVIGRQRDSLEVETVQVLRLVRR